MLWCPGSGGSLLGRCACGLLGARRSGTLTPGKFTGRKGQELGRRPLHGLRVAYPRRSPMTRRDLLQAFGVVLRGAIALVFPACASRRETAGAASSARLLETPSS